MLRNRPEIVLEKIAAADPHEDGTARFSFAEDVGGIELMSASYRWHRFPLHFHDSYSISVSVRGGLAFDFRGSKYVAHSGVISAIDPAEVHNAYPATDGGWTFLCLLVPAEIVRSLMAQAGAGRTLPSFTTRVIDDDEMARGLTRLHRTLETSPDGLERQSLCVTTLAELLRRHTTARKDVPAERLRLEHRAVSRAREFLRECYAERIPLERVSTIAGLSPYHFLRVFRSTVGLTPHAYLNHVRVSQAKNMLASGVPAVQVAQSCGFCDQSHFVRLFKEHLGLTPGRYQQALMTRRCSTGSGITPREPS
jgi:AraC-like DNA-binding protein